MTGGMKSGAGSDPFSDDADTVEESDETDESKNQGAEQEPGSESTRAESTDTQPGESASIERDSSERGDGLPYIYRRDGVKDGRRMIQYFLRDETERVEDDVLEAVEEELGTDVYRTDVREALVRVGAGHVDEVADELRSWGYHHEES